ncbi:UNVERIFIED_CONTAM: hypothetical protein Sradi_4089900 [Sesamum radiatum]|uniref:CCHC-type domain-containing protein n=1 Tax=Sesamum radiatum TaxID=300843 RepID=A0AAW2PJP1_SESRA
MCTAVVIWVQFGLCSARVGWWVSLILASLVHLGPALVSMESELGRLGASLSLTEEEEVGWVVPTGLWHSEPLTRGFYIVGRLVSSKPFHPEALQNTLGLAFNPVRGMEFKLMEENKFLLKFFHILDRNRVLERCPWAYDKNLLVLDPVEAEDDPKLVDLSCCDFHIHVHGLPLGKMTKEIASFIGNKLGQFKEVDLDSKGDVWGSSVRIRVSIDITKPLKRALKIRMVLGDEQLITFTYERLPNFYYLCGCLGHLSRQCEIQLQDGFCDPGGNTPYGNWLRAATLLSYRGRVGANASARGLSEYTSRPTFVSRSSLQSQSALPPTRRGSSIFGNFESPPTDHAPQPILTPLDAAPPAVQQGLGAPWTVRHLESLIRANNPSLVFLAETKCTTSRIESVKRKFDMNDDNLEWWRFTGIYGELDTSKRDRTWNLLSRLHSQSHRAWLCAGDFNEILDQSEKEGGPLCPTWQIRNFRTTLDNCGLADLGFTGPPFTWCNRHNAPSTMMERLDRACANTDWTHLFPDVSVKHEPMTCSDHAALIIHLSDIPEFRSRAARSWRFEAAWLQSTQCEEVVKDSWTSTVGNIREAGVQTQNPITPEGKMDIEATRAELERFAAHEETVWRQRSKVLWLREGDRNTGFFHRKASHRFRTNSITRIRGEEGDWVTSEHEIQHCISRYFGTIYASNRPSLDAISKGTEHLRTIIDASMRDDLLQPYSAAEVKKALFQMAPSNRRGPMVYLLSFFRPSGPL